MKKFEYLIHNNKNIVKKKVSIYQNSINKTVIEMLNYKRVDMLLHYLHYSISV